MPGPQLYNRRLLAFTLCGPYNLNIPNFST